ncbi:MAG: cation:proton antiporter [Dysgonamonadaceae bacterium]
MKKYKSTLFYLITVGGFSSLIYLIIRLGELNLQKSSVSEHALSPSGTPWSHFVGALSDNTSEPLSVFLFQMIVILIMLKICGWICKKIGQPAVIGEILAGIVLGPSLLGHFFPGTFQALFPTYSLGIIQMLSQIGLILFMFVVGMELNLKSVLNRAGDALLISHASIIFPFSCGVALAYLLYPMYETHDIGFLSFSLFIGITMSITAFPVLARIVQERGIHKTHVGTIVITCAAVDDITAWCILAAVIAIVKAGSVASSFYVILMAVAYVVIMLKVIRPFLSRIADLQSEKGKLSMSMISLFLIVLFLSSYATEIIGIHALFGAFMMGVIMPSSPKFRGMFINRMEDIVLVLFLPLFFVFTGLRTQIGLLNEWSMWGVCLLITVVATVGKLIGSSLSARFVNLSWKDSLVIGTLMNTRGLMQLVVLNIGYDLGVLSPQIFAMMVIMAIATTFFASPMLDLIDRIFKKDKERSLAEENMKYRVLCFFENESIGNSLIRLANIFVRRQQRQSEVTMLFLTSDNNMNMNHVDEEGQEMFSKIKQEAEKISQPFHSLFALTSEESSKIVKTANDGRYDFLLLEVTSSMFDGNLLGNILNLSTQIFRLPHKALLQLFHRKDKISSLSMPNEERLLRIISKSDVPVGIFLDKGFINARNVFVLIMDEDDIFLGDYLLRLVYNTYARITLLDKVGIMDNSIEFNRYAREIKAINPYLFTTWMPEMSVTDTFLIKQDLLIISLKSWNRLQNSDFEWKTNLPSTLVITE